MNYEFKINLEHKDLFDYSMNNLRYSKTFIFDIVFTIIAIGATLYMLFTGKFMQLSTIKQILLISCCLIFPVIQPIMLYIKTNTQAKKLESHTIYLCFTDDKIIARAENEKSDILYKDVYNFIKYKNMIVVMYSQVLGQIIPNRYINYNINEFFDNVSLKIKEARLENSNEKPK